MPRPTFARVDLACVRHNLNLVRELVGPGRRLLVPVKADAYGHGARAVARVCVEAGVDLLGVATVEEGAELREAGIALPIVLLGNILPGEAPAVVQYRLTASLSDTGVADALAREARRRGVRVPVFVEVDTGMGRVGVYPETAAADFIVAVHRRAELDLRGVFTHFPTADAADLGFARQQVRALEALRESLRRGQVEVPCWSLANSSGVCDLPECHSDLVRPGLMVYGYRPSPGCHHGERLRPAMSLHTQIVFTKRVARGTTLGYGRTYTVPRDGSLVATLPIGYADGYRRALSNRAPVLIGGQRYRVSGRISMDQVTVDLGPEAEAQVGDPVVLCGRQGDAAISADELAALLDTIVYEVTCGIAARVPRTWVDDSPTG